MTVDAWAALAGVIALVLGAIAGLTKAVADLITAWRKPDRAPAPEVGIPAVADHDPDDIDYRAYEYLKERVESLDAELRIVTADRDRWKLRALGVDEDTLPT